LLSNAALAFEVARTLGISTRDLQEPLLRLQPAVNRGQHWVESDGREHILDHYNSNPSSLRAGLSVLQSYRSKDLHVVLGDMLDLGAATEDSHFPFVAILGQMNLKSALFVGPEWKKLEKSLRLNLPTTKLHFLESSSEAFDLHEWMQNSSGLFLWKGSRGMALEKLLKTIQPS
jgi:UDP-N-acetylmuramoyl-tripeptide--D-alanyl-D-alanine ligase